MRHYATLGDTEDPESRYQARKIIVATARKELLTSLTAEEKRALLAREAAGQTRWRKIRALVQVFKYTKVATLTKDKTNPPIEFLRELALDDSNPDQWLNFSKALPNTFIYNLPLGKFRFVWGANGKPVFVPWTVASWENFFQNEKRSLWIPNYSPDTQCDESWENQWIKKYSKLSAAAASKFPKSDYRHVYQYVAGQAKCKQQRKSLWVRMRKVVIASVLVVAAVYLGPIILAKAKAALAGTGVSTGTAEATMFSKIQAGSKTFLGYVNKARTVNAVVKGKLPPPPIGIPGASFRDWALIVAKQKIKEEAMSLAMEKGVEYIEKKLTAAEERKLKAEIAEMQRQLIALMPPEVIKMPPEPDPELAEPMKKIQIIEEGRQTDLQKFIVPAALVAGALLLGG